MGTEDHSIPADGTESIQLQDPTPPEIQTLLTGDAGLSHHHDPVTTNQLLEVIEKLTPSQEEELFQEPIDTFQDAIREIHSNTAETDTLHEWHIVFGFDLEENHIQALRDLDGEFRNLNEIPPSSINTPNLINEVSASIAWAPWFGRQKRVFHYDESFAEYDYHFPAGRTLFTGEGLNPLSINHGGFSTFLKRNLGRKINVMEEMYEFDEGSQNIYIDIFIHPLAEAVTIDRNYTE